MIQKDFLELLRFRLKDGESSSGLRELMFSNFEKWEMIEYQDLKSLLSVIDLNELSLYSFLPFWYVLFGIDLFDVFKEIHEKESGERKEKVNRIIKEFNVFPISIYWSDIMVMEKNGFSVVNLILIRRRILQGGGKKVEQIIMKW